MLSTQFIRFTANLGLGSLVVASSDVLLDITNFKSQVGNTAPSSFPPDAVVVVSVPEDPTVATNHGVLVASTDPSEQPYTLALCQQYLQKPSLDRMRAANAIYCSTSTSPAVAPTPTPTTTSTPASYALIDTGVVIFTGSALLAFSRLSRHPVVSHCTSRKLLVGAVGGDVVEDEGVSTPPPPPTPALSPLRFELYSDILLALYTQATQHTVLGTEGQGEVQGEGEGEGQGKATAPPDPLLCLQGYYLRLGLEPPSALPDFDSSGSSSSSSSSGSSRYTGEQLYSLALPAFWRDLRHFPLFLLHVREGHFQHLGTSREIRELLQTCLPPVPRDGEGEGEGEEGDEMGKVSLFGAKLHMQRTVLTSSLTPSPTPQSKDGDGGGGADAYSDSRAVLMNSLLWRGEGEKEGPQEAKRGKDGLSFSSGVGLGLGLGLGCGSGSVVEHSVLSGAYRVGCDAWVSHVRPEVGRGLVLYGGMVLQQVCLKGGIGTSTSTSVGSGSGSGLGSVLLVLHTDDDVKAQYGSPRGGAGAGGEHTCCGVGWSTFFQVRFGFEFGLGLG